MGPLRGRRSQAAAVRLALERLLDSARAVQHAGRGQALRVERHKAARSRTGRVVRGVSAALLSNLLCMGRG